MNKEIDGFKIISFNKDKRILEFYLSSFKNKIFTLELYNYLGVSKLIFDKIYLKENFIYSLKQQSGKYYEYLDDFFKMFIQINK